MLISSFVLVALFILGLTSTIFKFPLTKYIMWFSFSRTKPCSKDHEVLEKSRKETKMGRKPHDESQLKMVFSTFDKNKDGFITKQELRESFEKIGMTMSDKEVEEMVAKSDVNGDGLIEFDEFCNLYTSISGGGDDVGEEDDGQLREAFNVFDGDKDGMISVEELGVVLKSLGMEKQICRVESCEEMIKKVDEDGDGMVSFDEFKVMMKTGGIPVNLS